MVHDMQASYYIWVHVPGPPHPIVVFLAAMDETSLIVLHYIISTLKVMLHILLTSSAKQ